MRWPRCASASDNSLMAADVPWFAGKAQGATIATLKNSLMRRNPEPREREIGQCSALCLRTAPDREEGKYAFSQQSRFQEIACHSGELPSQDTCRRRVENAPGAHIAPLQATHQSQLSNGAAAPTGRFARPDRSHTCSKPIERW